MFSPANRRKRNPIPQTYRTLDGEETALVAAGAMPVGIPPGVGGGNSGAKDPNG